MLMWCSHCQVQIDSTQCVPDGEQHRCPTCKKHVAHFGREDAVISDAEALAAYDQNSPTPTNSETTLKPEIKIEPKTFTPISPNPEKLALEDAIARTPTDTESRYAMAKLCFSQKDFANAKRYLTQLLEIQSNHEKALQLLCEICFTENDLAGAIKAAEKIVDLDPANEYALYNLATIYGKAEYYDKAYTALKNAKTFNSDPEHKKEIDQYATVLEYKLGTDKNG